MKTIVVATQNKDKVKEIKELLADLPVEVKTMGEVGINIDIEENGTTFEENAISKAEAARKLVNALVIADDSGREIDYLNKLLGERGCIEGWDARRMSRMNTAAT